VALAYYLLVFFYIIAIDGKLLSVCCPSPFSLLSLLLITSLGRIELFSFLFLYLLTVAFQLVTTGSILEQGSTPLVYVTAIHAGLVVALFWSLLANAIVATQVVEDGSMSSLIVCFQFTYNSKF